MSEGVILDTDVIFKVSAFRMAFDVLDLLVPAGEPCTLGLTHLIAEKQFMKHGKRLSDIRGANAELKKLLNSLLSIEPTDAEINQAAELEEIALELGVSFDRGEAQLVSVLLSRELPCMLTGDKRAIFCIEDVLEKVFPPNACAERVICIEQIINQIVVFSGIESVRSRICSEPNMDISLRNCFSCSLASVGQESIQSGLDSYISYVREHGRGVLFNGDISALAKKNCVGSS
jgi:hypothetical protein